LIADDRLCGITIVEIEHPAEPLTTFHFATVLAKFGARIDEHVFHALVISLGVIMSEIFMNSWGQKLKQALWPTKSDLESLPESMISVESDGDSWQRSCADASKRYQVAALAD